MRFFEKLSTYYLTIRYISKQTKEIYTDDHGNYTKERRAMHKKVVNRLIKKAAVPLKGENPNGFLLGGGTASGKSTLLQTIIIPKLKKQKVKAVFVDPDAMKLFIPEYKHLKRTFPVEAAKLVHKESQDMAELLLKHVIQRKMHFVLESTLAKTDKYEEFVKRLKRIGFSLHLFIVDVPLRVAIIRSDERGKRTGRFIPHQVIKRTHRMVPRTFEAIKCKVDSFRLYDNQKGLQLAATDTSIENPEIYRRFISKGGTFRCSNQIIVVLDPHHTEVLEDVDLYEPEFLFSSDEYE